MPNLFEVIIPFAVIAKGHSLESSGSCEITDEEVEGKVL